MILDIKPALKAKIKKHGKWCFVICIVTGFLIVFLSMFIDNADDTFFVEDSLLNNQLILSKTGEIEEIFQRQILVFSGDNNKYPYKEYLYLIKGANADVLVRVKLRNLYGEQFLEIISMESTGNRVIIKWLVPVFIVLAIGLIFFIFK